MSNFTQDFISGRKVRADAPEELVRQRYGKILHYDFGYALERMDIEVAIPMGSTVKKCDIGVFADAARAELVGIIEIKSPKTKFDPKDHETIIDPACGSGGFLIAALNHIADCAATDSAAGV